MKKFKLPRKLKKILKHKFLLYPADSKGNSLMAWPCKYEKDYNAYKRGELRDILADCKFNRKDSNE